MNSEAGLAPPEATSHSAREGRRRVGRASWEDRAMRCSGLRLLGPARRMELVVQPVFARVVEVGVGAKAVPR